MVTEAELEATTRDVGRRLAGGLRPWPWRLRWWDERLMAWVMGHESLRLQAFRFVDVLPMLEHPAAVADHLGEYLDEVAKPPWPIGGVRSLLRHGPGPLQRLMARQARWAASWMARRFIAGAEHDQVMAAVTRLRKKGLAFSLDLLGEVVLGAEEADAYLQRYQDLAEELATGMAAWDEEPLLDSDSHGPMPRLSLSVKLSSLSGRFRPIDPEGTTVDVLSRLRPLLRSAREAGAQVYVDMENYAVKDLVLHIVRTVLMEDEFRNWGDVGVALQAYLSEADDDLDGLLEWVQKRGTPIWIRLVKGAYWDFETITARARGWPIPVYQQKWQADAAFERLSGRLMHNASWLRPALGSHNLRSLARGIACARKHGVANGDWEVQVLYGMADTLALRLAGAGYRVRVYAPFGDWLPGMAYLVRRLLENTSNESFLRAASVRGTTLENLLMAPQPTPDVECAPVGQGGFLNEPQADFSRDEAREAMTVALDAVSGQLGVAVPLLIDGVEVTGREPLISENPSDVSQVVGTVGRATAADAQRAIQVATGQVADWGRRPVEFRSECLRRAAELMRARRWELSAWIILECGKPRAEAEADVVEAIDFCEYYADGAERLATGQRLDVPGETNRYGYRPRGVVSVIAPWNFPLAIPAGMTVAALVTGNPVVLKPAEQSPVIASRLVEILHDAGVPTGVLQCLPGIGEELGPTLIGHPDVALVAFTGSREVGLSINRQAAELADGQRQVRRVIAEMGGKNAIIVDDDADLDQAVAGVIESAFGYAGQKCSACSRVIVLEPIYKAFLERLVDASGSLVVGPAREAATVVGPVIDGASRSRIERAVQAGRESAREVLAIDVGELATQGHFVGPHIFADVDPDDRLAQHELFGPVLAVLRVNNLDEAFAVANGTDYALTGGIYSRSPGNLQRARCEFEVGNLYLNRGITGAQVGRHPFGGFRLSGIGSKAGGPDYLGQFVLPVHVTENTLRQGFSVEED